MQNLIQVSFDNIYQIVAFNDQLSDDLKYGDLRTARLPDYLSEINEDFHHHFKDSDFCYHFTVFEGLMKGSYLAHKSERKAFRISDSHIEYKPFESQNQFVYDLLISYSSEDYPIALKIKNALKRDLNVYLLKVVKDDYLWDVQFREIMNKSLYFLPLFSYHYLERSGSTKEFFEAMILAEDENKMPRCFYPVIPIVPSLETVDLIKENEEKGLSEYKYFAKILEGSLIQKIPLVFNLSSGVNKIGEAIYYMVANTKEKRFNATPLKLIEKQYKGVVKDGIKIKGLIYSFPTDENKYFEVIKDNNIYLKVNALGKNFNVNEVEPIKYDKAIDFFKSGYINDDYQFQEVTEVHKEQDSISSQLNYKLRKVFPIQLSSNTIVLNIDFFKNVEKIKSRLLTDSFCLSQFDIELEERIVGFLNLNSLEKISQYSSFELKTEFWSFITQSLSSDELNFLIELNFYYFLGQIHFANLFWLTEYFKKDISILVKKGFLYKPLKNIVALKYLPFQDIMVCQFFKYNIQNIALDTVDVDIDFSMLYSCLSEWFEFFEINKIEKDSFNKFCNYYFSNWYDSKLKCKEPITKVAPANTLLQPAKIINPYHDEINTDEAQNGNALETEKEKLLTILLTNKGIENIDEYIELFHKYGGKIIDNENKKVVVRKIEEYEFPKLPTVENPANLEDKELDEILKPFETLVTHGRYVEIEYHILYSSLIKLKNAPNEKAFIPLCEWMLRLGVIERFTPYIPIAFEALLKINHPQMKLFFEEFSKKKVIGREAQQLFIPTIKYAVHWPSPITATNLMYKVTSYYEDNDFSQELLKIVGQIGVLNNTDMFVGLLRNEVAPGLSEQTHNTLIQLGENSRSIFNIIESAASNSNKVEEIIESFLRIDTGAVRNCAI